MSAQAQPDPKEGAEPAAATSPPAPAEPADPRRVERVSLPDGRTVVVAEGEFEPRATGSYSLRLYAAGDPPLDFDRFLGGVVQPRDGALERVLVQDLDRDGRPELVVVLRAPGGALLSAHAWSFGERRIARRASLVGLPGGADPAAALAPRLRRATAP